MSNVDEIESLLSQLRAASTPVLSNAERAEVQKFIDVGEYGLALETAADIYSEERKIAPVDVVSLVERLAAAMSMDPKPRLQKLPK
jgi:dihydroxyacetone kinase DhaKLM complex PTS-EIIA-like component DhaM